MKNLLSREDLPQEVLDQLEPKKETVRQSILNVIREINKPMTIDDCIVALYNARGKVLKRTAMTRHLQVLFEEGRICRPERATYKIKD